MRKRTILFFVFFAILVFTGFSYYNDIRIKQEQELVKQKGDLEVLQNKLLRHIDLIKIRLPLNLPLYDLQKHLFLSLSEIANENSRIGLYIDRAQCESCWQDALAYLNKKTLQIKDMPTPFVLAGGYNVRELKLLSLRYKAAFPMYAIEKYPEMDYLTKSNYPFFFILSPDGIISSVFYPDGGYFQIGEMYFKTMAKKCQKDKPVARTVSTVKIPGIELLNPIVDLGEVHMRKKKTAIFSVRNSGNKKCTIKDVRTQCNCTMLESTPKIILPGETAEFKINFLSANKGEVIRAVEFVTDQSTETYELKIKAKVI